MDILANILTMRETVILCVIVTKFGAQMSNPPECSCSVAGRSKPAETRQTTLICNEDKDGNNPGLAPTAALCLFNELTFVPCCYFWFTR